MGKGHGGLDGDRVCFWGDAFGALELERGGDCTTLNIRDATELHSLKGLILCCVNLMSIKNYNNSNLLFLLILWDIWEALQTSSNFHLVGGLPGRAGPLLTRPPPTPHSPHPPTSTLPPTPAPPAFILEKRRQPKPQELPVLKHLLSFLTVLHLLTSHWPKQVTWPSPQPIGERTRQTRDHQEG